MSENEQLSTATARKLRIVEERLGQHWRDTYPGKSIDAVYNAVVGDTRKNLFAKVLPDVKEKLDEMVIHYDVKMSELLERFIETEYDRYLQEKQKLMNNLARDFSGS